MASAAKPAANSMNFLGVIGVLIGLEGEVAYDLRICPRP
jgi:hypothetical protein